MEPPLAARRRWNYIRIHQNGAVDAPVERFFPLAAVSCFVRRKQDVCRSGRLGLLPGLFNVSLSLINSLRFGTDSYIANRRPKRL